MSTPKVLEGTLTAADYDFALVASRFNHFIVDRLMEGAMDGLTRSGVNPARITIVRVPGSFELPQAAARLARSKKYDAVICVGAVIRGGTAHFDLIANEVTKGLAQIALETEVPVVFGVVTTDTIEQAIERAGTKAGNKGFDAAQTAVEMVNLYRAIDEHQA